MAKLPQFIGLLTSVQIADGMTRALTNSERLAKDADSLLRASSPASALALAILSLEESGKLHVLRQLATSTTEDEAKKVWKDYRRHTSKNIAWIFGQLVANGGRQLKDFAGIADPSSDHPAILDQLKQLSFYTDCFSGPKWSSPAEMEIAEILPYVLRMATIFGKARIVTPLEVELWRKNMTPVKAEPQEVQNQAAAKFFAEMNESGLGKFDEASVAAFLGLKYQ